VPPDEPLLLRFAPFELDERQARLMRAGQPVAIAPKAFEVLCALARTPGQLVRKDELLDAVWGHRHVSESVLKTIVSELRAALGDDARQPRYIETASRRGYRFIASLQLAVASAPARSGEVMPAAAAPTTLSPSTTLIGRDAAREQLHAAWSAAGAGRRQLAWLTGEAGIGKTTLIEYFVGDLGPRATVAHGQCVEQHGAGEPYLPILEALGGLCRDDASATALLRSVAPTWLLQLPWLASDAEREALRRELTGIGQERMLREFGEWLDRFTQQRTLLLVTEDLHWSDHATLRLLDHVARRRGPARLLWLASFRLAEVIAEEHPLGALRHELRLHRLITEIPLEPFSEREVADCIAARLAAGTVSEAVARRLHARTDGLPLFVVSVLDDWQLQGVPQVDVPADSATPGIALPESLGGVIERQVQRLDADARLLLEAASVCGVEFSAVTLADVLERDAIVTAEQCDELARRQQWLAAQPGALRHDGTPDERYAFRHALVRQVFYQRIGATRRMQWHRRVALSMLRRREDGEAVAAAELALHFELGHDIAAALGCYAGAAESALRRFAPSEAITLTSHALPLLPRVAEGFERLSLEMALLGPRAVATSQVQGVTTPATRAIFERLEWLCEQMPEKASRALAMGYGWALYVAGEYEQALQRARHKLELAERRGDRVLRVAACNLRGATLTYQGQLPDARHWLERGIEATDGLDEDLASALSVTDLEVSLRSRYAQLLAHLGEVDTAQRQIDAAHARVERLGQPYARRLALIFESFLAIRLEQPERVQRLAETMQRIATEHAIAQAEGPSRWLLGWARARLGDPLAGHALILDGYARDERLGVLRGRSGVLGYAAEALMHAGRWDDARRQLDEAVALAARMGERLHEPDLRLLQGRIALAQRDVDAARASMRAALDEARRQQALWLELTACVALCSLDGARSGDFHELAAARTRTREGSGAALVARADALLASRAH